jgi:hypothetical protein
MSCAGDKLLSDGGRPPGLRAIELRSDCPALPGLCISGGAQDVAPFGSPIRNVISAIERERTTPALAALAQHSNRQINGDLDPHVHPFLFLQRELLEREGGGAPPTLRAWASGARGADIGRALRRFLPGNNKPPVESPLHRALLAPTQNEPPLGCPSQQKEIHDMPRLLAPVLATTAVGLIALATPAFAEVIMTPEGHYYNLVPMKAPPG